MKETIEKSIEKSKEIIFNKESQEEKNSEEEERKNINQRIEDLVNEMEKTNALIKKLISFRTTFLKGLLQGLGIIIGSTILAGLLYSMTTNFFGKDVIKPMSLDSVMHQDRQ